MICHAIPLASSEVDYLAADADCHVSVITSSTVVSTRQISAGIDEPQRLGLNARFDEHGEEFVAGDAALVQRVL